MTEIAFADSTSRTRPLDTPADTSAAHALRVALPKGRTFDGVLRLLADAGLAVAGASDAQRGYRPQVSGLDRLETKLLKPQAIVSMLDSGSRDVGFAGADWACELGADLVELLDTELDPVRLVVAAPDGVIRAADPAVGVRVASEYAALAERWIDSLGARGRVVRSFGATEVLPPEDADCILDVTQTGSTLRANGLEIVETVMASSTRLYASREAMACSTRRPRVEELTLLLRSALEARSRLMVELNVDRARLESVLSVLPCMRRPTISPLYPERMSGVAPSSARSEPQSSTAFAVKAAVPKAGLPQLVLALKARGASDIVITPLRQVVP